MPDDLVISPSILYFGTPVVLVTTMGADGRSNISPMSSAWALGDRIVLGFGAAGQGVANLRQQGECVLNFPSASQWENVERIAAATGRCPVPDEKARIGFAFEPDKFSRGGFTPLPSDLVGAPRIAECPLQFEARLTALAPAAPAEDEESPNFFIAQTKVLRVHAHKDIVIAGTRHIDTQRWRPLLYVFRHYFGTGERLGRTFRAET